MLQRIITTRAKKNQDLFPIYGDAEISECGLYRYKLMRRWEPVYPNLKDHILTWVMLNPSTADGLVNDPTITRCMGFAQRWGYSGIDVLNLFAFRATDPADLSRAASHASVDPIGPKNDLYLFKALGTDGIVVAAWGAHKAAMTRAQSLTYRKHLWASLGVTKAGHPRHPLYVSGDTTLESWEPAA